MTAQTYMIPSCDKGTSTPVIDIQFVNVVNGLDEVVDMSDVPITLSFYKRGCSHTPAFELTTAGGEITATDGANGWIKILSFIADYEAVTYDYSSKFLFPDGVVLSYIKGTFSIIPPWPKP